jgi:nucleotide-binding universal stress UspA family protein
MGAIGGPIVVGYVDTPEGKAALERAVLEAQQRSARLIVINSHKGGSSLKSEEAVELDESLGTVHDLLHETGVEHEVRQLVRGSDPSEDLIAVAEEVDADLIVIGLRRRSPVGKLIMGSNAQAILLDAACPVLAVKAP